jgi:hypothetical protein
MELRGLSLMFIRQPKPNPYSAFKDDRQRLRALVSRDLRLVAIAACFAIVSAGSEQWGMVMRWVGLAA